MANDEIKVTEKSRKADIWKALKAKEKEFEKLRGERIDTAGAKADARSRHLENSLATLKPETVIQEIAELKTSQGQLLSRLGDELEARATKLTEIDELISHKEAELKEIYEIERSADTLAAIVATQEDEKEAFEAEIVTIRNEWIREQADHEREIARRNDEFEYTFKRNEQAQFDSMRDRIQQEKRNADFEVENRMKAVAEKEEEQNAAIARAQELEAEMESLKAQHATEVEKAADDARTSAERSAHFQNTIKTKDYEAKISVLEGRVESMTAQLAAEVEENIKLKEQLADAMTKVQQVAMGALESKNAQDQIATLQSTLTSLGGNSNGRSSSRA